jgi:hypothetical protein
MAANLDQTVPWHESPWAKQSMAKLRRLYANSTFAIDNESPFELMILSLRHVSVPVLHLHTPNSNVDCKKPAR